MILVLVDVDVEAGRWTADPFLDDPYTELPPVDEIRDYLEFGIRFQELLGGGECFVFVPEEICA